MANPIHALGAWFARTRAERAPLSEEEWAAIERPAARAGDSAPSDTALDAAAVDTEEQADEEEEEGDE